MLAMLSKPEIAALFFALGAVASSMILGVLVVVHLLASM